MASSSGPFLGSTVIAECSARQGRRSLTIMTVSRGWPADSPQHRREKVLNRSRRGGRDDGASWYQRFRADRSCVLAQVAAARGDRGRRDQRHHRRRGLSRTCVEFDSTYGRLDSPVSHTADSMKVGDRTIAVLSHRDPAEIDWGRFGAEIVLESTGQFRARDDAARHLKGGARKVLHVGARQGRRRDDRGRSQ